MGATEADASAVQFAFVSGAPAMIGNLNGVAFWARDKANRITLTNQFAELARVKDDVARLLNMAPYTTVQTVIESHGFENAAHIWAHEAALIEIRKTLSAAGDDTFQLVTMDEGGLRNIPRPKPLVAISIGEIDTATQVTVTVPGMGTTVQSSMQEWTEASRNLFAQQNKLNSRFAVEEELAVVSWIGYEAPKMPPSPEVLSSEKARIGAQNLAGFLDGVSASRGWTPGQNLSIVAHSYGTTTATLALAETSVENLTLLASAGLDESLTKVSDLKVASDRVWVSEANGDNVADIGRLSRAHPTDPSDVAFGAKIFSSESAVVDGQILRGSDWHESSPQTKAEMFGEVSNDWGYLDKMTTPLYNTGLTSLGLGHTGQVVAK